MRKKIPLTITLSPAAFSRLERQSNALSRAFGRTLTKSFIIEKAIFDLGGPCERVTLKMKELMAEFHRLKGVREQLRKEENKERGVDDEFRKT